MKLAVIGGGGVRSPMLARSIARRASAIGLREVVFMDTDAEKLGVFGALSIQIVSALAPGLSSHLTTDLTEAVRGADFIITTIRAGGDGARARDERIALEHGVIGQETTGAGGFAMAMRTVPAMTECCRAVAEHGSPGAIVLNFTNPAGLVTQAMRDQGFPSVFGICDAPSGLVRQVAELLHRRPEELDPVCLGLNHLSYFTSITLEGKELIPRLLEDPRLYEKTDMRFFEPALARRGGMLLNEYLYYYYYREKAMANMLSTKHSRGESIREINAGMFQELIRLMPGAGLAPALQVYEKWVDKRERSYMAEETGAKSKRDPFRFRVDEDDGGGYAGVALGFMEHRTGGASGRIVLNLPNDGAIPGLADDDVVEVTCTVDASGVRAARAPCLGLPPSAAELVRRVKTYERLAATAIVSKDRDLAIEALFLHPLVASYSIAESLVSSYLAAHADSTGPWTGERAG
jgi:6-phospho-beta-glucosidase